MRLHVYVCIYTYIYINVCIHIHVWLADIDKIRSYMLSETLCVRVYTYIYAQTHTDTHIHVTWWHAPPPRFVCPCFLGYMHTYRNINTHTRAHMRLADACPSTRSTCLSFFVYFPYIYTQQHAKKYTHTALKTGATSNIWFTAISMLTKHINAYTHLYMLPGLGLLLSHRLQCIYT